METRQRWWQVAVTALVLVALASAAAPLFATRELPLIDLPNHLAVGHVWAHLDDPARGYAACYERAVAPLPYFAYYGWLRVGAEVMPVQEANRLWMLASLAGLAAALAYLLRGLDRPAILGVAALPLYWGFATLYGFVNFTGALAILLAAWGVTVRLRAERADLRRWLVAGALGVLLYFVHPLVVLVWLASVPLCARGTWQRLALPLPTVALFLYGLSISPEAGLRPGGAPELLGHWSPIAQDLEDAPGLLFSFVPASRALTWTALWLGALAFAAALVVRARPPGAPAVEPRGPLLALVGVALYLLLPLHIDKPMGLAIVSQRFVTLAGLGLPLLVPRGALAGRRAALALVPLVALGVWQGARLTAAFARATDDDAAFARLVDRVPRDRSLLVVLYQLDSPAVPDVHVMRLHQAALAQIRHGGYDAQGWNNGFPLRPRPACVQRYPLLHESRVSTFRWPTHQVYDYFLLYRADASAFRGQPARRVATDGPWSLWQRAE